MPCPPMSPEERVARFWSKVDKTPTCWLWTGATNKPGYGKFWDGEKIEMAHRHSYKLEHGALPAKGIFICHTCDVPACVRPEHLFPGTQQDNARDAYRKGRLALNGINATGKGFPKKLSEFEVAYIRSTYAAGGVSQQKLADQFGITQNLVSKIVLRRVWRAY